MQDVNARVLACEPLAEGLTRIILEAPEIAGQARAGQFVQMLVPDHAHVLRRPISLMAFDPKAGTLTFAIQKKGRGTHLLCAVKPGGSVRILGHAALGRSTSWGVAWGWRPSAARWTASPRKHRARFSGSAVRAMRMA